MEEGKSIPINRGIEIQKSKIEEILSWATARYRDLAVLSRKVEDRIDGELSKDPAASDLDKLVVLFEQKNAMDDIGREIEALILRNFSHQDELAERWRVIEERMTRAKENAAVNYGVT